MRCGAEEKSEETGKLYAFGRMLLSWFYLPVYRIHVLGGECSEEGPVLLCSNHVAMKDPVMLGIVQKRQVFYMAKEELSATVLLEACCGGWALSGQAGYGRDGCVGEAYTLFWRKTPLWACSSRVTARKQGNCKAEKTGAALLCYHPSAGGSGVHHSGGRQAAPAFPQNGHSVFGKPVPAERLQIPDDSSMQL